MGTARTTAVASLLASGAGDELRDGQPLADAGAAGHHHSGAGESAPQRRTTAAETPDGLTGD